MHVSSVEAGSGDVVTRKPLDQGRHHSGLGIGHRKPVHALAARARDAESTY